MSVQTKQNAGSRLWLIVAIAAGTGMIAFAPRARNVSVSVRDAASEQSMAEIEQRNNNIFAMILGEARATTADFMFIKTDRYMHDGIAYLPHLDMNEMARSGDVQEKRRNGEDEKDAEDAVDSLDGEPEDDESLLVIPTAGRDFRGWLGELERQIKPYPQPGMPHTHRGSQQLLPWYRMMTLVNPRHVRGYMIGAMWLASLGEHKKAVEFLEEGIRNNRTNPDQFRLYMSLAGIWIKFRHLEDARSDPSNWLPPALEAAKTGFELGKKRRPMGWTEESTDADWSLDLEEDLRFSGLYYALLLREKEEYNEAARVAKELIDITGPYGPAKKLIQGIQGELNSLY